MCSLWVTGKLSAIMLFNSLRLEFFTYTNMRLNSKNLYFRKTDKNKFARLGKEVFLKKKKQKMP